MAHDWMTVEEAIERLEGWREAAVEAAQSDPDWLFDRAEGVVGDQRFRVKPFDQDCVFRHAADVVAFDVALAALRRTAANEERPRARLMDRALEL